jgi:hypothetical protein
MNEETLHTGFGGGFRSEQALIRSSYCDRNPISSFVPKTRATVARDAQRILTSSSFNVRLCAVDVDNMPIGNTRADMEVSFGNNRLGITWNRGSNEHTLSCLRCSQTTRGQYDLVVAAISGWDSPVLRFQPGSNARAAHTTAYKPLAQSSRIAGRLLRALGTALGRLDGRSGRVLQRRVEGELTIPIVKTDRLIRSLSWQMCIIN